MNNQKYLSYRTSTKKWTWTSDGFTLIEGLITIAIMSIAGLALMSLNVTGMKANKSAHIRADLQDVKRTITNLINCDQTLGTARPTAVTGAVTLKDKNGNPLVGTSGKIGEWTIEAAVESLGTPLAPGLSIYATKPGKMDPIRSLPLDRNHPVSALFNPDVRLCGENFKSTGGAEIMPLYGNYTGPIVGAGAINGMLKTGIEMAYAATYNSSTDSWSGANSSAAQDDWTSCKVPSIITVSAQAEKLWNYTNCQHRLCNGHFRNKANPINLSPTGFCGRAPRDASGNVIANGCTAAYGVDIPVIGVGCMWTKDMFDANKVP